MAEPKRDKFPRSPLQRTLFFTERGGVCECDVCRGALKIQGKSWEIDHIVPRIMGGGDEWSNLRVIATACHRAKTAKDVAARAKSDSVRARHLGAHRPKRALPGSRRSEWKRKIDGQWVRREGGEA